MPASFDYRLFHGGVDGSNPADWFLRSDFVVPLVPIGPSLPSNPSLRRSRPLGVLAAIHTAAGPAAARRRVSDHRAGTRHLWGRAASGAAIGAQHPRHARRPKGRSLRAGWLRRRSGCGRFRRGRDVYGRPCRPGSRHGLADQEGAWRWLPAQVTVCAGMAWGRFDRPADPQQLSSLRRSQRQRRSGRLPGRDRSPARPRDPRWRLRPRSAFMAPMATCTPT